MICGSREAGERCGRHVAFDAISRANFYVVLDASDYFDFFTAFEFGFDAASAQRIIDGNLVLA